jgi:hypothetical protein
MVNVQRSESSSTSASKALLSDALTYLPELGSRAGIEDSGSGRGNSIVTSGLRC